MPRRRTRRRLKKRQAPRKGGMLGVIETGVAAVAPYGGYVGTAKKAYDAAKQARLELLKAVRKQNSSKGRGRRMKKEDPDSWAVNEADGIKFRNYRITYKKSKLAKLTQKLSPVGNVYDYTAAGVASPQGNQQAEICSASIGSSLQNLYDVLNLDASFSALGESRKMYLGTIGHNIQFSNAGNTTLDFDIYILIDKTTSATATAPGTVWDNAIAAESSNATAPAEAKTDLWVRPTMHKSFNIHYWTRRLHCSLTPGENCRLDFRFNVNRLLDTQYFNDFQSIRGISHHIMVVTRGSLADGVKGFAITANQQTITPSKLIWMVKRHWTGSILATTRKVSRQIGAELPSGIVALYQQDEDNGIIENAMDPLNYA